MFTTSGDNIETLYAWAKKELVGRAEGMKLDVVVRKRGFLGLGRDVGGQFHIQYGRGSAVESLSVSQAAPGRFTTVIKHRNASGGLLLNNQSVDFIKDHIRAVKERTVPVVPQKKAKGTIIDLYYWANAAAEAGLRATMPPNGLRYEKGFAGIGSGPAGMIKIHVPTDQGFDQIVDVTQKKPGGRFVTALSTGDAAYAHESHENAQAVQYYIGALLPKAKKPARAPTARVA